MEIISWDHPYVPYPYWPIKNQFKKITSGGAILSRWPMGAQEQHFFQAPKNLENFKKPFYPRRYIQKQIIHHPSKDLQIINLHLEAFYPEEKAKQLQYLSQEMIKSKVDVIGGDFNLSPKGDYNDDFSFYCLERWLLEEYQLNGTFPTFPSDKPIFKIDYILTDKKHRTCSLYNGLSTNPSDHLPLMVCLELNSKNK